MIDPVTLLRHLTGEARLDIVFRRGIVEVVTTANVGAYAVPFGGVRTTPPVRTRRRKP